MTTWLDFEDIAALAMVRLDQSTLTFGEFDDFRESLSGALRAAGVEADVYSGDYSTGAVRRHPDCMEFVRLPDGAILRSLAGSDGLIRKYLAYIPNAVLGPAFKVARY